MREARSRWPLPGPLGIGAALLLLLAVVAAATRGRNPFTHLAGGSGPSADFVSYAWTTALTVSALVLVAAIVLARQDPQPRRPQARNSRWYSSVLLLFLFVLAALLIRAHTHQFNPTTDQIGRNQPRARTDRPQPPQRTRSPSFRWDAFALIVGTAAAVAGAALVAARRRRGGELPEAEAGETETALALSDALDDSLDDLRREPDLRKAVIAAYARMERALAAHGLARARWEAPLEYMTRVLGGVSGSREAVARLTTLFEEAKFSGHRLAPAMREEAIDALVTVRDDLRRAAAVRAHTVPA